MTVLEHPAHRRPLAMGIALAVLASLLVLAPAALRRDDAGAVSGIPPENAPYMCGGTWTMKAGYAKVQVPAGSQIAVTVTATGTPGPYPGGPYVSFYAEASFQRADGSELWETALSGGGETTTTKSKTNYFTNSSPDPLYIWLTTADSRLIIGNGLSVTATVSFSSGGTGVPCLPLTGDEFAVPNEGDRNSCGAQPGVADPINVVQGNFWDTWTDLQITGRGPGIDWARTYSSSRASTDGPLGYGWTGSYFMRLVKSADVVSVSQENGAMLRFAKLFGGWQAPGRTDAKLVEETDGTFTLTRLGRQVFRFAADGTLAAIKDLSGNTVTLGYTSGKLATITDPAGRTATLTWTGSRISKVAAPSAALSTGGAAVAIEVSYSYDASGNLSTVTDTAGGIWTFTYDGAHRVLTVREPRHHSLGAAAPVVENHYDTSGRVDWQEDRLDRRVTFSYASNATTVTDPAGHVVVYEHTDEVCTGIIRDPGANQSRWVFEIDPETLGRTKVTDPNGNITTAVYDSRGRPTRIDESGRVTELTYTPQGLPATVKDPSGVTTTYGYDAGTDRLRSVSRPVTPGTGTATTSLNYTDPANPGMVTTVVDVRGKTWTMAYTATGDLASSTDPTGKQTTWAYNSLGWPLSTVVPVGNAVGGTPSQHRTSFTYNRRAQVMASSDPLGAVTEYDRDLSGNVIAMRDPVASGIEQTGITINSAGEIVTVTRPGGSTLTTDYWPDGAMKTQRDGASVPTAYAYDAQGRLSTITDPSGRVTTFRYDAGGRVVTKQQPGGNCLAATKVGCVTYAYSSGNDVTGVDYSESGTPDVTFGYDSLHRRTTMSDGAASTWSWDSLGRLLSFADANGTTSYTFTDNGPGATTITYPGSKVVSRSYDDAGRQITSTGWAGGTATYGYDANSNPTTIDTGATTGVEDTFGYDRANRMTAATLRQGTTVLTALGYGRDPEGMVTSATSTGIPGAADTYTYGPFDQVATTTSGSYAYDAADNLTGFPDGRKQRFSAGGELCYQAATNTAPCGSAPAGATRYDYDGRGNRTASRPDNRVPTTMTYDQADRMVSAKVPAYPDGTGQYHDLGTSSPWLVAGAAWASNQTGTYQITGANGIPASGVESVVLRLHVAWASNFGFLEAYPTGTTPGTSISMYYDPGDAASNLAISKLSASGQVTVKTSAATSISIELVGWYGAANADGGTTFEPVTPGRPFSGNIGTGGVSSPIQITGANGVPASGVSAVAVVAHSVSPSAPGYLTVYSGATVPTTVSLLYDSAAASALTIVPLGPDGQLKVYASQATTAAIDVVGYYTAVETGSGNVAHTLTPFFVADTVNHTGVCNGGTCNRLVANTPTTVKIAGTGTVPSNAAAVAVVVHAYFPDAVGYLQSFATGGSLPPTATMTFDGDGFIAAMAILPVGTNGMVTLQSSTGVDVIVQPVGYFDPATKTYTYAYSGDGLRRQKTAPDGTTTRFVWDRSSAVPELLAEVIDEPGTATDRTVRYLYGPDGTVTADVTTMTAGGAETLRWFHHDQLGSTVAITNATGALLGTASYTPVGATGTVTGTATTPMGWAGEYRDTETGFVYLRARYYDPATAQFLTRDPLEALTRSAYGYVNNNPLNLTDPTGLFWGEGVLGGIADFFTGGDCGDGLLGAVRNTTSAAFGTLGDIADSAADLAANSWRTWTLIGTAAACVIATGGTLCPALLLSGFAVRSGATVVTHGFTTSSLRTITVDAVFTGIGLGLSGAIRPAAGALRAGPVTIPPMSAAGVRLVQAIWAPFDLAAIRWVPGWLP